MGALRGQLILSGLDHETKNHLLMGGFFVAQVNVACADIAFASLAGCAYALKARIEVHDLFYFWWFGLCLVVQVFEHVNQIKILVVHGVGL